MTLHKMAVWIEADDDVITRVEDAAYLIHKAVIQEIEVEDMFRDVRVNIWMGGPQVLTHTGKIQQMPTTEVYKNGDNNLPKGCL